MAHRRMRSIITLELAAGLIGSVALTLYAAHRIGAPAILQVLFAGWVATPFVLLAIATAWSATRPGIMTRALETVTPVVAFVSLAIYAAVALGPARPKTAVFVLVAPGSWIVIVAAAITAVVLSRGADGRV